MNTDFSDSIRFMGRFDSIEDFITNESYLNSDKTSTFAIFIKDEEDMFIIHENGIERITSCSL